VKKTILVSLIILIFYPPLSPLNSGLLQEKKRQKPLEHEVTVTLKLIQVFVTDRKGNPVTDLEKSDFMLYDNGKLKTVTDLEKHFLTLPQKKVKEKAEEQVKETPLTPPRTPSRLNRKFFFLVDMYQNDAAGLKKSKNSALHFIDTQLQPTDEVCVLSYSRNRGLILHEYLTADHQKAREAVKKIRGIPGTGGEKSEEENDWVIMKTFQYAREIKDLAKSLRYIPGFKNIIFFSAGVSRKLLYGLGGPKDSTGLVQTNSSIRDAIIDLSKELASSNCPVYTVNTEGARGLLKDIDKAYASQIADDRESEIEKKGDHSLQMISDFSGGKYFADVEQFETIAEEIQNVTANFYVLGYYIDEKWDGKYHTVDVKVKRKGCRVYAQGGYFNPKPFTEFSEFEKQLHLMSLAMGEKPYFQEPLNFPLIALPCSDKNESNVVLLSEIQLEKIKEIARGKTELITLIFDKENNIVDSARGEAIFASLPQKRFYHYTILSAQPGQYECRVIVRNLKTGKGAVAFSSVIIPESSDSGLKLYPPLLLIPEKEAFYLKTQPEDKAKESLSLNNIYPFLSNKFSPVVNVLDRGVSKLLAVLRCSIINIPEPEVEFSAHIVQQTSGQKIPLPFSFISSKEEDEQTDILLIELQLPGLMPGQYSLEIIAEETTTQSKSKAVRTFRVEK
jgi:VWFA-related protein